MPRPYGNFATGSKLLQKKWEERNYKAHQQKVQSMKTGVDNSPPKQYPHLVLRLKKIQKEEERQEQIDHDNQLLLHKMTHIMKNKSRVDNWSVHEPKKTLHQAYRERELERIREENAGIARRLEKIRPSYDVNDWEAEFDKHEYYLDIWSQSTKDYQVSPRNGPAKRSQDYEYESDFEDDDRSHKLPKIESRESTLSDKRTARKDPTSTKLPKIKTHKDGMAEQDAKTLFKATKQLMKPEDAVIRTLIRRSHSQRMATKDKFEQSYDLDLASELKSVLSEEYGPLIDALLAEREGSDANTINKAIKGNDINALVEVLCSRNSAAINSIHKAYSREYGVSVADDLEKYTKDEECKTFLLTLFSTKRPKESNVSRSEAEDDARDIYQASGDRFGKGEIFLTILEKSSMPHVKEVASAYSDVSEGATLEESMKEDRCSDAYIKAVQYMTKCMNGGSKVYAEKIHSLLLSGDTFGLASLLLERSELDMTEIRKSYKAKYGVTLADDLQDKGGRPVGNLLAQIALKSPAGGAGQTGGRGQAKGGAGGGGGGGGGGSNSKVKGTGSKGSSRGKAEGSGQKEKKKSKGGAAKSNSDEDDDVTKLHEAMSGFGTDEQVIIDVLTGRTNAQRQEISKKYKEKYDKELMDDLKSELRGDFEEVVVGMMMTPTAYDAHCLRDAVKGMGTREAVLIGILSTRNAKELNAIAEEYKKTYKSDLADDVHSDTSGDFQELLMKLLKGDRDQGSAVNNALARQDAEKLAKDEEGKIMDDDDFREILTMRNRAQLKVTFEEYNKVAGHSIEEGIKQSMLGDAEDAYLGLVQASSDPVEFYARRLHSSFEGMGTNDTMLIRIVLSRAEVDIGAIKAKYQELYGDSLEEKIDSECSGDYRKALLAIIKNK